MLTVRIAGPTSALRQGGKLYCTSCGRQQTQGFSENSFTTVEAGGIVQNMAIGTEVDSVIK